jgi:AmiR/NasT family two-component response regulator
LEPDEVLAAAVDDPVVNQAQGVLMAQLDVPIKDTLTILRVRAISQGIALEEVAEKIVAPVGESDGPDPDPDPGPGR